MIDNGQRMSFETGAIREPHDGKGAYHLLPYEPMRRVAMLYEQGARKYADRNWEKGLPTSNCYNSMLRHAFKAGEGMDDEDHLAAVVWNAFAIMFMEKHHPELCDLPTRGKKRNQFHNDITRCTPIYSYTPVQGGIVTEIEEDVLF